MNLFDCRPALGNLFHSTFKVSLASSIRLEVLERYLQSDVELAPGFSGSLLVDAAGRVLGLNTSGLIPRTALAIPAANVQSVVESVLAHGHVRRAWFGIVGPARMSGSTVAGLRPCSKASA